MPPALCFPPKERLRPPILVCHTAECQEQVQTLRDALQAKYPDTSLDYFDADFLTSILSKKVCARWGMGIGAAGEQGP